MYILVTSKSTFIETSSIVFYIRYQNVLSKQIKLITVLLLAPKIQIEVNAFCLDCLDGIILVVLVSID